jgi:hypothetical protein
MESLNCLIAVLAAHKFQVEFKFSQKLLTKQEIRCIVINLYGVTSALNVYVFLYIKYFKSNVCGVMLVVS